MNNLIKYVMKFETVAEAGDVSSDCNAISFINQGATALLINGLEVAAGDSFTLSGEGLEYDTTVYRIQFTGSGANKCVIVRKFYQNEA